MMTAKQTSILKKTKLYKYLIYIPALLVFLGCASSPSISNFNYSYLYDDEPAIPRPEFQVFHQSKDVSELHFKINSKNILYSKTPEDTIFSARLQIKYKVFDWENRKELIDSATVSMLDFGKNNEERVLTGNFNMNIKSGKRYIVEIIIRDTNRDLNVLNYHDIDKRMNTNRQFFLIRDSSDQVIFGNKLLNNATHSIHKSQLLTINYLPVKLSNEKLAMAPPPFSDVQTSIPQIYYDSNYTISFYDDTASFKPRNSSIHHFFPEVNEEDGFYLYHFREDFPYITNTDQMLEPLRYISTQQEYNNLKNASNKKKEMDSFWLRLAGNEDRARKLMSAYYSRVEKNNIFFSSYKEGWKTDRGIIYLIYGPPSTIYKTPTFESWIYGEESNILSLTFKFRKRENPMSDNDFILMRDISMKPSWYREVDSWRQGRIN